MFKWKSVDIAEVDQPKQNKNAFPTCSLILEAIAELYLFL